MNICWRWKYRRLIRLVRWYRRELETIDTMGLAPNGGWVSERSAQEQYARVENTHREFKARLWDIEPRLATRVALSDYEVGRW